MEATTNHLIDAAQSAVQVASGLAVAYAFSILGAVVLLVLGYVIAGFAERWSFAGLSKVRGFDETLRIFLSKMLRYAVLIMVGVTVLAQFGVQTASIIAALGAVGLAIGLALQGTLQNIASGIMLLVLRPFRVGEYITVGTLAGTVLEIGLFATVLRTWDGLYVMAPNNQLWNSPVTNFTRNPRRLDECAIGIGYDDDLGLALKTLAELAADDKRVLKDPAPVTYVKELGASAVLVVLRYWTASPDWWATKVDMVKTAKAAFEARGISIPFPQQDVHHFYHSQSEEAEIDPPASEQKKLPTGAGGKRTDKSKSAPQGKAG